MNLSSVVFGLVLGAVGTAMAADAKVEEQVVGPVADNSKFIVSPRGVHLATAAPKGSRMNVIVDGVAGPRFDDIPETAWGAIDPRPSADIVDPNSRPRGAAVTFSRDGNRYAYLGRLGQEWVLMVDNKEVLRLPVRGTIGATAGIAGSGGNTDVRMEFSGENGKHLLLAKSSLEGYELWVDGQKWPGFYQTGGGGSEGTLDPIISPDGEHIAYVAQISREKTALIVDGKDAGYFGTHLQYTADSKHLISVNDSPKGQTVLVDGKTFFTARQIQHVYVPPAGNRLIFALTHFNKAGNAAEGSFLLVDGKPVEASLTPASDIVKFIFSPDGKHYAAVCGSAPNLFVVIDGKKGQEYFMIDSNSPLTSQTGVSFSPDSSKLVYTARTSTLAQFVVVNDEESNALKSAWFQFSADGKHLAYGGIANEAAQKSLLSVDGKTVPLAPGWIVFSFTFSPDGSHYAFVGQQGGNKGVFLDGKNTELTGDFAFSPDSRHFAVAGFRPAENKAGFFVDGQLVFETYDKPLLQRAFTPDGQHLFWMTRELVTGPKAAPGLYEYVVYLDGNRVARCDDIAGAMGNLRNLYGFQANSPWKTPTAWNITPAGQLAFLGPVDDGIKRLVVAPPADTSVDTMIAEAKAAPARAAAKAAEEKKKADEAAAAKKAKADADAAEAAAKAKAEYDAAVAKRKADYDAAVAKRKAEYDAAIAKRKADYDAAVAAKAAQQQQQQKK